MPSGDGLNLAWVVAVLGLAACTPPPVYSQRYAALVPHAAPPLRTGAPVPRGGELALGDSTLGRLRGPREGDPDVGLHIPRTQLRGELRGGNGQFDFGLVGVHGLSQGATSLASDQPTPSGGGVTGVGGLVGGGYALPDSPFAFAIQGELMFYRVPYVMQQTCAANCPPGELTTTEQDEALLPGISVSLVPTYRFAAASLFAGLTFQSHPVIQDGDIDVGFEPTEEEPEAGPMISIASVGGEIEVFAGIRIAAMLYQPIGRDPVDYGPAVAAFITIPFAREPAPTPIAAGRIPPATYQQPPASAGPQVPPPPRF